MTSGPARERESPAADAVLAALHDGRTRRLLSHLDESRSAEELAERSGIPLTSVYRKLDRLAEATLVRTGTEIRADGHHTTIYRLDVSAVTLSVDDDGELGVAVERPAESDREPTGGEPLVAPE